MKLILLSLVVGSSLITSFNAYAEIVDRALTADKAIAHLKSVEVESRVNSNLIQQFFSQCQEASLDCSFIDYDKKSFNKIGEALYREIKKSDDLGLSSKLYHIDKIEDLLNKDNLDLEKVEVLLIEGALSYIRDVVEGRPELKRLDSDWLLTGRKIDSVKELIAIIKSSDVALLTQLEPHYSEYKNLKIALKKYQEKINQGLESKQLSNGKVLRKGDQNDRVLELRLRLIELGFLDQAQNESQQFDATLEAAVKAFQENHLLEPDGVVGRQSINEINMTLEDRLSQIKINLERWRWMPESLGNHYLVVDIPKYEYAVYKEGAEVLRAKTVVGMNRRKTPVFSSNMSYIVFSPYWNVPRSMAIKDQLPKLRQDPYRLERSNIRIYDRAGNEVDPGMIDWNQYTANTFPFTLRQDPGAYNSLGRVKFMFPNEHAIYLHDTPQRYLFDKTARTFSSGCIRIENPTELAEYLLEDQGWSKARIEQSYNKKNEASVRLTEDMKFPVYTLYMTAEANDQGEVSFRPDIYEKDEVMIKHIK